MFISKAASSTVDIKTLSKISFAFCDSLMPLRLSILNLNNFVLISLLFKSLNFVL